METLFNFKQVETNFEKELYLNIIDQVFKDSIFVKYGLDFKKIDDDSFSHVVSNHNNKPIGIFSYSLDNPTESTIDYIGLLPSFRGRGLGSKLLKDGIDLIKDNHSIKRLIVEIILDDISLLNFYVKNGFYVKDIKFYHYIKEGLNFEGTPFEFNRFIKSNRAFHFQPFVFLSYTIE